MKTVVALYDKLSDANASVRDLVDYGIPRDNISLMANDASGNYSSYLAGTTGAATGVSTEPMESTASGAATGAGIGAIVGGLGGLLVGLGILAVPGVGPVLAAGPLATAISALTGAGVGAMAGGAAGGLIGALVDLGLPEETAGNYAEGIRRGGILVTVRTEDHQAEDARRIMNRHNVVNLDDRVRGWREQGWTGYREENREVPSDVHSSDYNRDYSSTEAPIQGMATGGEAQEERPSTVHPQGTATGGEETGMSSTAQHGTRDMHSGVGSFETDYDDRFIREYDPYFRQDYSTRYAKSGHDYNYYRPGYYYGYQLANESRYRDYSWDRLEPEARRDWETRYSGQGAWEDFKDTVRDAWMRVKEGVRETFDTNYDDRFTSTYDPYFRQDFSSRYANRGHDYTYYQPAYYYGYQLAGDDRYRDWTWEDLEPEARRDWETRYQGQGAWEDFKDAVHDAWMRVKQGVRETFD